MHVRNLHTTTCNLLVNFTTPTHSVSFKFTSRLQVYRFNKVFSHLYRVHTVFVCSYAQIDTLSLSLCTLDTPYVHVVSCNLICCCVMQNDRTPLYLASFRGHTEIVAMLLKFGADFNSCHTVSTSYFIIPISAVSGYVDVYTYVNIDPCNPRRTHAQRGLLYLVCVSVCVSVCLHLFLRYRHQTSSWVIPTALPQQALEN